MDKISGMIKHTLPGWNCSQAFSNRYKRTKENLSINSESLHSMILRGDQIPHFAHGTIFRITPSPMNRHHLGIATRHGPVVVKVLSKNAIQLLMNAALEPYLEVMRFQQFNNGPTQEHPLNLWLGHEIHHKHCDNQRWYNLGEVVERAEANE